MQLQKMSPAQRLVRLVPTIPNLEDPANPTKPLKIEDADLFLGFVESASGVPQKDIVTTLADVQIGFEQRQRFLVRTRTEQAADILLRGLTQTEEPVLAYLGNNTPQWVKIEMC